MPIQPPPQARCAPALPLPDLHSLEWQESPSLRDDAWDSFLESTPLGHFQQSSCWAEAKSIEGWKPIRYLLTSHGQILGGFQILSRQTRFGSIGYISKGPVLLNETPALVTHVLAGIKAAAANHRLRALVVQAPDSSGINSADLAQNGFLVNQLVNVIRATLLVDLSLGMDAIAQKMRKNTWIEIRQAQRRGVTIREGHATDVPAFFRLMAATCQRQNTEPSPASVDGIKAIWKAFESAGAVKLFFAEYEGDAVAGALCLCFGSRVTIWKKGWSGAHRERHPSQLLLYECVRWAAQNGFALFDFAGLDPQIAAALLHGQPLSEQQKKSRDFVHLSYGNRPLLLPEDRIYLPNKVFSLMYRFGQATSLARPLGARLMRT